MLLFEEQLQVSVFWMSFHEESQLSGVLFVIYLIDLYIFIYITIAELPPTGVPAHWFSLHAGFRVKLIELSTLGKN